jgi:hypothetical protein
VAISLLPDDAEIRLLTRSRTSSIDIPMLEEDRVLPTRTDSDVLNEMTFGDDGKFYWQRQPPQNGVMPEGIALTVREVQKLVSSKSDALAIPREAAEHLSVEGYK